jgi:hypothetical protein
MLGDQDLLRIYLSVKKHFFDKKYDLGKDKIMYLRAFQKPPRETIFLRTLHKKYTNKHDLITFMVANFAYGNDNFIYSLDDTAYHNYDMWVAYKNSYTYRITQENEFISKVLSKNGMTFDELFVKTDKNSLPPILTLYLSDKISIQYLCTLDNGKNFLTEWLEDDSIAMLLEKDIRRVIKTKFFLKSLMREREIVIS